jgi:hypothetical protein
VDRRELHPEAVCCGRSWSGSREAARPQGGKGTITISLTTDTPNTGSGLPDLAHDLYWLMKELPGLSWESNGKMIHLGDKYSISSVQTEAE